MRWSSCSGKTTLPLQKYALSHPGMFPHSTQTSFVFTAFQLRTIYKDDEGKELQDAEVFLQTAILQGTPSLNEVNQIVVLKLTVVSSSSGEKLMALLQASGAPADDASSSSLSRSVTSVGERSTGSGTPPPPLPKRADTFSGFETRDTSSHRGALANYISHDISS